MDFGARSVMPVFDGSAPLRFSVGNRVANLVFIGRSLQWTSDHHRRWLFGICHREPFERGHPAEFLISCDERCDKSGLLAPESDR